MIINNINNNNIKWKIFLKKLNYSSKFYSKLSLIQNASSPLHDKIPTLDLPKRYVTWNMFIDCSLQSPQSERIALPDSRPLIFFFNLHSGGWNQGPLDTAVT
jgi:hypothetical protein